MKTKGRTDHASVRRKRSYSHLGGLRDLINLALVFFLFLIELCVYEDTENDLRRGSIYRERGSAGSIASFRSFLLGRQGMSAG